MKLITSFDLDTGDMSAIAQTRSYKIIGEDGAVFSLRVFDEAGQTYDFKNTEFVAVETSSCRLANVALEGNSFSGEVSFPSDNNGTYTLEVTTSPHFNTKIAQGLLGSKSNGDSLSYNSTRIEKSIKRVADTVLTFGVAAATEANFISSDLDQISRTTQSPVVTTPATSDINWKFRNNTTDAQGFGFLPVGVLRTDVDNISTGSSVVIGEDSWYADTTVTISDTISDDGGGSDHFDYQVDKNSHLTVGMKIVGVSSGSLAGSPVLSRVYTGKVKGLNFGQPSIKLSAGQVFANGVVLTVRAYGIAAINRALQMNFKLNDITLKQTPLTTTVRGAVDNATAVTVSGTYGISKGAFIEGFGINNSVSNPIVAVADSDASEGILTLTVNQTIADKTVLSIIGSSNGYTLKGNASITTFPPANQTIYLDLDKILTLGTAS